MGPRAGALSLAASERFELYVQFICMHLFKFFIYALLEFLFDPISFSLPKSYRFILYALRLV